MRNVTVLGITGSIGSSALRGISSFRDRIRIVACSCNSKVDEALRICLEYGIPNLCITSQENVIPSSGDVRIWTDLDDMLYAVPCDMVLNGIAGSPGLKASFSAIRNCRALALANKESVVLGGHLLFREADKYKTRIIPVDSEHSAIDELLSDCGRENVDSLIITASGGPFRSTPIDRLAYITPEEAANHPTWKMGPKISIDSSTLANKGLEVIEAHYLFGFDADHIQVVIHPQSVVHSMVRAKSGQIYAQMSPPDMVFPIMRALLWPIVDRPVGKALDFTSLDLTFRAPDFSRYPFVADAFECVRREGSYPIVYNMADEIAVSWFRQRRIAYTGIHSEVRRLLEMDWSKAPSDLDDVMAVMERVKALMDRPYTETR